MVCTRAGGLVVFRDQRTAYNGAVVQGYDRGFCERLLKYIASDYENIRRAVFHLITVLEEAFTGIGVVLYDTTILSIQNLIFERDKEITFVFRYIGFYHLAFGNDLVRTDYGLIKFCGFFKPGVEFSYFLSWF